MTRYGQADVEVWNAEVERLRKEEGRLLTQVAAALALHKRSRVAIHRNYCLCGDRYPCKTARALGVTE